MLDMIVRQAKIKDVPAIGSLINHYAEQDQMLFRPATDIYENLQTFTVVELDDTIVGCCTLHIIWQDLAEIKSLAVDPARLGVGIGKALVENAVENARCLGIAHVFALTLKPDFFKKMGFGVVEKDSLPMKVWSDCAKCSKQENCDEVAVFKNL